MYYVFETAEATEPPVATTLVTDGCLLRRRVHGLAQRAQQLLRCWTTLQQSKLRHSCDEALETLEEKKKSDEERRAKFASHQNRSSQSFGPCECDDEVDEEEAEHADELPT